MVLRDSGSGALPRKCEWLEVHSETSALAIASRMGAARVRSKQVLRALEARQSAGDRPPVHRIARTIDHRLTWPCSTTNRAFKDWTKVFPDALNAQVIAERLTERAEHFVLEKGFRTARP